MADTTLNLYTHREAAAWNPKKKNLPVTLVTGFLGAGKTTLLKYILKYKHNLKIAAAVNDFAALNIDGQIIRGTGTRDEVVELSNGCLCCSVSGEFKKAVWKLLQDADIGKINYLVIETSGVTDPHETIATLEQEYGRMYRVRLDVVVTVVDTDVLVTKLDQNSEDPSLTVAADSQLRCADVILLNKRDLVTEDQLEVAKRFVSSHVPGARIHPTTFCAIPLDLIMEVTEVKSVSQLVTHEVAAAAYTISTEGGLMNAERHRRQREVDGGGRDHNHANHLSADELNSVVFESPKPFSLTKFQTFLRKFPTEIIRMKGSVWFSENRSTLYSFHMSGRFRYELSVDTVRSISNSSAGAFGIQLVTIGKKLDNAHINTLFEKCLAGEGTTEMNYGARVQIVCDFIKANDYFVLVNERDQTVDYVDFWLSGCVDYGVSVDEATGFHGINFNRMNEELAKRVNGSSQCVSVLSVQLMDGKVVCRHSVSEEAGFEESWRTIHECGKKVVSDYFQAVGVCKCGR